MIEMSCPHCGHPLRIPDQYAGQIGGCRHCSNKFTVPAKGQAAEPPDVERTSLDALNAGLAVSPAVPTARNHRHPSTRWSFALPWRWVGAVAALVLVGALIGVPLMMGFSPDTGGLFALGGDGARTPRDAVARFFNAVEAGDLRRMEAVTVSDDPEAQRAMLQMMAAMAELTRAIQAEYGKTEAADMGLVVSMGEPASLRAHLNSADIQIREAGTADGPETEAVAVALIKIADDPIHLVKRQSRWFIDLSNELPKGAERASLVAASRAIVTAGRELRGRIGQPGVTAESIMMEIMGVMMGAAMGMAGTDGMETREPAVPHAAAAGPLPNEQQVREWVVRFFNASDSADVDRLRRLVSNDCRVQVMGMDHAFWDMYTPEAIEAMRHMGVQTVVDHIEVLERTPEFVRVSVTATTVSSHHASSSGSSRLTFQMEQGAWRLSYLQVESVSMSM